MKNAVLWDVMSCGIYKNRCFGGIYRLHHQDGNNVRDKNKVSSSSLVLSILMMEAKYFSETSVFTRAPQRQIQEDGILPPFCSNERETAVRALFR
jgi:hypothetical protein